MIPVCSDSGCTTKKYVACANLVAASGGPCFTEFSIDYNTPGGIARVKGFGDLPFGVGGGNSPMAIPPSGLPSCSASYSASRVVTTDSANFDNGVVIPEAESCDGAVDFCPACIYVSLGPNLCSPSAPNVVQFTAEEARQVITSPATLACGRVWIIHLTCPWLGKLCIQYCCPDFVPSTSTGS